MTNTLYSANFYEEQKDKFEGKHKIITPEKTLEDKLSILPKEKFPEDGWNKIVKTYASEIAENLTKQLLEEKKTYIDVRNNPHVLGYSDKFQETQVANRIVTYFEYNCYKLSKFKKQYNL
jgi:hypothetical protein